MSLFFFFEDQQNEIIVETLIFISIFLVLTFQLIKFKQCTQQKSIYEQSYIKQSPSEFEQNKQQLTKYHMEKLQENPKFREWQESSKKS
ncbi:unnamed protein product (macronuclear) [Paramecium tetraurelia]|uniref:Transmembrane protein n=1 Tax=Paramecium tetraurelia TaxID=5888 RepID=A0CQQ8_PARTE|nr:uncharacterized protein GSPATT00009473001 [Paramecium tetraurelia]CAK73125.1 unnamed protein product [Paramecium tetraurelia]|eukprot:XP_001440522.1 hypothetical protein (macronuclear) [Paramecium tetraurelia strain d4-2]